jgi:tRNA 2-selenouridine synthase
MYSYQREQKKDRVIFQGEADAVLNYLRRHG